MTLGLALIAAIAVSAGAGRIAGVDLTDDRIRMVVRLNEAVGKASAFVFADPDRAAVDVEGAKKSACVQPARPVMGAPQSAFAKGITPSVFDMTAPIMFTTSNLSHNGLALTLDLSTFAPENIEVLVVTTCNTSTLNPAHMSEPPRTHYALTVPLRGRSNLPRPRIAGTAGRPLVVIDAGHGGHDPGAIGPGGEREKDVTLALARAVRDELLAGGRVRVALTRDDDRFLVLGERSKIARALGADLFISIHADSAPGSEASGATIYTLSEVASGRTAARLAARENRADIINGVNLGAESSEISSILIDLAQRETMNASSRFADLVHREAVDLPFKRDYHQMADFAVLKAPDTPAILFEVGYITSPTDLERLLSTRGRSAIARTLRRATDVHFARRMASR